MPETDATALSASDRRTASWTPSRECTTWMRWARQGKRCTSHADRRWRKQIATNIMTIRRDRWIAWANERQASGIVGFDEKPKSWCWSMGEAAKATCNGFHRSRLCGMENGEDWWKQEERHGASSSQGGHIARTMMKSISTPLEWTECFYMGQTTFMRAFATRYQDKTLEALEPMERLLANVQVQPARQAAKSMLHHCVAAQAAHLLRLLSPSVTTEVAGRYQEEADTHVLGSMTNGRTRQSSTSHESHCPSHRGVWGCKRSAWRVDTAHVASWMHFASQEAELVGVAAPQTRRNETPVRTGGEFGGNELELSGTTWQTIQLACRRILQKATTTGLISTLGGNWRCQVDNKLQQFAISGSTRNKRAGAGVKATPTTMKMIMRDPAYGRAARIRLPGSTCRVFRHNQSRLCGRENCWTTHTTLMDARQWQETMAATTSETGIGTVHHEIRIRCQS